MFTKIMIVNRGEIAARVVRTCRRLGIKTVAIYSEADTGAPHTQLADEAFLVGPAHVQQSYLNIDRILEIAKETGVDAIHPGYGLLSENASFVQRVEDAGITFIGPSSDVINLMGDKAQARAFAENNNVPVVPGSAGALNDEQAAVEFANNFGYPVLVKASAGGGGIGMKVAHNEKKLRKAITQAQRRAESAFGNAEFYLERYIENPRHVEVQVFGDSQGNAVHLFERECSVQRRHQKVIEEAPSIAASRFDGLREAMTHAAVKLVKASKYVNAGTVEFIVDNNGNFYFIEMNTRLQVEHTVTEMITGFDLVEWQINVAAGHSLPVSQEEISLNGHSIECRIYAENPDKKFMPAPGQITQYIEPEGPGIRVDSGVKPNWAVTPYYDPLISKLVVHDQNRSLATEKMIKALDNYIIDGIISNKEMHKKILANEDFVHGDIHTGWLEDEVSFT